MKPRLVLHLSGSWTKHQDALLEDGDILFRMPGLSAVSQKGAWQELPRTPEGCNQALLDQYVGLFDGIENQLSSLPFASLVNDQFIYSVLPVAAALMEIFKILEHSRPSQIVLFHSKKLTAHIPATGFTTIESSRGSRDVLGSIVAESVKAGASGVPVVSHRLKGDALSHVKVRRAVLCMASSLILLRFVFRMLRVATRRKAYRDRSSIQGIVLVRSVEHARHARRIFSGIPGVGALVTPQFTQGSSEQIRAILEKNLSWFVPGTSVLLRSLFVALSPKAGLQRDRVQRITCGPFSFTASLRDLQKDYNAVRFYAFQNALLRLALRSFPSAKFTAGFEVQGAFAWIEGCIPRGAGLATRTIQPVLVQKRSLPVFPFSDRFLTDSIPNLTDLADIGALRFGSVDFQASPFEVRRVQETQEAMALGFFTQPYETENNVQIVETLCKLARTRGWTVTLRLHPREDATQFDLVLKDYPAICSIAKPGPLEDFLETIDVSITRTSSITKEAIAYGCPCVNVLMSDLDRGVPADYIRAAGGYLPHVVTDVDQMLGIVCDPIQLREASEELQKRLFEGRGLPELKKFFAG